MITNEQVIGAMQTIKEYCNHTPCKTCIISDYCGYNHFDAPPFCDIDINELREGAKEDGGKES